MEQINIEKKELIISLIQDDLKNIRLVAGLEALGLDSANYYLNLSQTFFTLLDFEDNKQNEKIYKAYSEYSKKVLDIDINEHPKRLNKMAVDVYLWLKKEHSKQLAKQSLKTKKR